MSIHIIRKNLRDLECESYFVPFQFKIIVSNKQFQL